MVELNVHCHVLEWHASLLIRMSERGVELRGVAFMIVLAVLAVLTVLTVSALLAVSVVTANPLELNPPFPTS